MEISHPEEEQRLLQSGFLEMQTMTTALRSMIAQRGSGALAPLRRGRYGLCLNGQSPNWTCPHCGAKKFCPVLQLPYNLEVECSAGVIVCDQCSYCDVVPVRAAQWGRFGQLRQQEGFGDKLAVAPEQASQLLVVSEELPSLSVAGDLVRLQDSLGCSWPFACNWISKDSFVRKASRGERVVGFALYSFSVSELCWWDVAVAVPAEAAEVGKALFSAMVRVGIDKLYLRLLHDSMAASVLTACGITFPPWRGERMRLHLDL